MMVGGVIAVLILMAVLLWLLRGGGTAPLPGPSDAWERAELEEAERDVQQLDSSVQPGEELPGDDWGPGAPRRRRE